jgi:hypothetical protein
MFHEKMLQLRERIGGGAGVDLPDVSRGQIRQQQCYCGSILTLDCQIFQRQYQERNGSAVDRAAGVAVVQSDNCHKDLLQMSEGTSRHSSLSLPVMEHIAPHLIAVLNGQSWGWFLKHFK